MNQRLDGRLAQFAGRPLTEAFPYLILDARYERVREAGVILSQAVLIAIGIRLGRPLPGAGGRAR
jgi:putative transposase